jgi:hypothetical protein
VLTRIEMLDRAIEHYSRPGAVYGYDPGADPIGVGIGKCCYRGKEGAGSTTRCFLGLQIPDQDYDPVWDDGGGKSGESVIEAVAHLDLFDRNDDDWLIVMQDAHDDAAITMPIDEYVAYLRKVRRNLGLSIIDRRG